MLVLIRVPENTLNPLMKPADYLLSIAEFKEVDRINAIVKFALVVINFHCRLLLLWINVTFKK